MDLPNDCPICRSPLQGVAMMETDEGSTLSFQCASCGKVVLPPETRAILPSVGRFVLGGVAEDLRRHHKEHPGGFVLLTPEHFGQRGH